MFRAKTETANKLIFLATVIMMMMLSIRIDYDCDDKYYYDALVEDGDENDDYKHFRNIGQHYTSL